MSKTLGLVCLLLSSWYALLYGAGPPREHKVLLGGIASEGAFTCVAGDYGRAILWGQYTQQQLVKRTRCSTLSLVRWKVYNGSMWIVESTTKKDRWGTRPVWVAILWYDLKALLKGYRVRGPRALPDMDDHLGFTGCGPVEDTWTLAEVWGEFHPVIHYDIAPAGRTSTLLFLLTNVGGGFQPRGRTEQLIETDLHMPLPDRTKPRWSMTCYSTSSKWKSTENKWEMSLWKPEFSLEVGIREAFHALSKGEDYYFLTETGRLFRAARPVKGTFRKMETTYAERDRPVTAFLTDADTDRVFLFRHASGGTGKPSVAELAPRLAWREYDPALYRPGGAGPGELRRVVGYARVLQALGLVPAAGQGAPGHK